MTKLFGREPTLWIAAINAVIVIIGTFGLRFISGDQAGLIVAVINAASAAANAWTVRPLSPTTFSYLLAALLALAAGYGLSVPAETVTALNLAIVPVLALLSRNQVTPAETPVSRESTPSEVKRETGP